MNLKPTALRTACEAFLSKLKGFTTFTDVEALLSGGAPVQARAG